MDYQLDANFLIGLWRRPRTGPEVRFLQGHPESVLGLSWMAKGEFLRGASVSAHEEVETSRFLDSHPVVWPTEATLRLYAKIFAHLRARGRMIGPNDLWIAASALEHGCPLLTRNVEEFRHVEGLVVVDYVSLVLGGGNPGPAGPPSNSPPISPR